MSGTMKLDEIEIIAYKQCWLHLVTKSNKKAVDTSPIFLVFHCLQKGYFENMTPIHPYAI